MLCLFLCPLAPVTRFVAHRIRLIGFETLLSSWYGWIAIAARRGPFGGNHPGIPLLKARKILCAPPMQHQHNIFQTGSNEWTKVWNLRTQNPVIQSERK